MIEAVLGLQPIGPIQNPPIPDGTASTSHSPHRFPDQDSLLQLLLFGLRTKMKRSEPRSRVSTHWPAARLESLAVPARQHLLQERISRSIIKSPPHSRSAAASQRGVMASLDVLLALSRPLEKPRLRRLLRGDCHPQNALVSATMAIRTIE